MYKLLLFLLAALVLEALGVVYLSKGLKQLDEPTAYTPRAIGQLIVHGATNANILIGVAMETAFFVMLMILLRRHDVSLIWPLTSLGFVLTALAARFIRHEEVSMLRWSGVVLIVVGAMLVGWSEKAKAPPPRQVGRDSVEPKLPPRDGLISKRGRGTVDQPTKGKTISGSPGVSSQQSNRGQV